MSDKSIHDSTRSRSNALMPERDQELNRLGSSNGKAEMAHEPKRPPRRSPQGAKILHIPPELIPKGHYARWINTSKVGRFRIAHEAYYEPIKDHNGVNLQIEYKGQTMLAVSIEQKYRDEDEKLKEKRHNDMIGASVAIGENEYSPLNKKTAVSSSISDSIDD
jgi:hypothetical protein